MAKREVELLSVGGDDSNHAGTAKGEIIVAAFSFLKEDSIVKDFPNTRDYQETLRWLSSPNRDYRYALLTAKKYRHSSQNLVGIIPHLVNQYIEEQDLQVKTLKIFLDGLLATGSREIIRKKFEGLHGIEKVVVDNFIKKNKFSKEHFEKHPHCPPVVYYADIIANHLYATSLEDSRLIFVD